MYRTIQNPLVSIIMPVYNTEKYLEEALYSVSGQLYDNIEIICIDDGSIDSSPRILQKWKEKDQRIRVITQENQGPGVARNSGMKAAKGKYMIFLDADDVFHKQMIYKLVRAAEKNDTDIVIFRYYKLFGSRKYRTEFAPKSLKIPIGRCISPIDISDRLFQTESGMSWNKLYKTEFVKRTKVCFPELKKTEDEVFSRMTEVMAKRILFLDKTFVGYRVGNTESLQGRVDQNILDFTSALEAVHDGLKSTNKFDLFYETYQSWAVDMIINQIEEKQRYKDLSTLVNEIGTNTLKRCEIDEIYVKEGDKGIYKAIQAKDISQIAFEISQKRKREATQPIFCRIKRSIKSYLRKI